MGTVCFGEKRAGYPPRAKRLWDGRDTPLCPTRALWDGRDTPLCPTRALWDGRDLCPTRALWDGRDTPLCPNDLCHILVPPGGLAALPAATLDGSAPDGAPPGMRPPIEQPSLIARVFHRPLDGETPGFESPRGVDKQEEAAIADDLCHILVPPGGLEPSTFRSGGERSNPLSYRGLCADEYSPKRPTRLKKPSAPQVVYLQHINYEQVIARDKAVLPCSHQQFADSPARRRKEATPCL